MGSKRPSIYSLIHFYKREKALRMPSDIKSENNTETKVLITPTDSLENASDQDIKILKLKHPKTGEGAFFLYNKSAKKLFEMLSFEEEHRSWFIGSKVVPDGRIFLVTPVNPVFLVLPYLIMAERLVPLDQMLQDDQYPESEDILLESVTEDRLQLVSDSKGSKDLNVWKYNKEKTLDWLEKKVRALGDMFEKMSVDTTGGASSSIFKAASTDEHEYLRYGLGVVLEYLDPELGAELETKMNLPKVETKTPGKRLSSVDVAEEENKPRKKAKVDGPIEDYSKQAKKVVVKDEPSAKDKALAQSAKGTKSIMSFFGKKK